MRPQESLSRRPSVVSAPPVPTPASPRPSSALRPATPPPRFPPSGTPSFRGVSSSFYTRRGRPDQRVGGACCGGTGLSQPAPRGRAPDCANPAPGEPRAVTRPGPAPGGRRDARRRSPLRLGSNARRHPRTRGRPWTSARYLRPLPAGPALPAAAHHPVAAAG